MSIQEVVDYVMESPSNTNPTILKQKINEYAEKNGGSGGAGSGKLVVEFNMESHNPTYGGNVECNMDYASLRDAMLSGNDVDVRLTNKGNDKFNYLYSAPLSLCFFDPSDGGSPKIGVSGVVSYRKGEYSLGAGIVCIEYPEYGEISLSFSEVTFN